jgi:hypothetical protein
MDLAPIVHEYPLRCSAERAFEVFTARIGAWWHPEYTADPTTLRGVTIEPRVGGRVYATHEGDPAGDGWGQVLVWEPGRRVVYSSTLAQSAEHPSEISVSFTPRGDGCWVRFEHGGWDDGNAADRRKFTDWRRILDRFATLADGE